MNSISVDLETHSSVNLAKSGVFRYCEADDFEILLFGYSIDGGDVHVIDLAGGEKLPEKIIKALTDESIIKWAFNAAFERICLSRYLGLPTGTYLSPDSWRCTMIWSAYLGLPLSLVGTGVVLGLEKQKLFEGKELIKYFCTPCTPTMSNGNRIRNHPSDAPDKWDLFIEYNKRDVEVELAIHNRLSRFPVPDDIWDEYHLDQRINDRGVLLDRELVVSAMEMDKIAREELMNKMRSITDLENPNSVQQLKQWLADHGLEVESLGKKDVKDLLKDAPRPLQEVLKLRLQLAKSSVKKYQAMEHVVCSDGRARGMFQFYGANRTGRWCLTGDHEVLTINGWERLDEWKGGLIASWSPVNEGVVFSHAKALCFDYEGPMYEYRSNRIAQISTPDHRMYFKKRRWESWQVGTVTEMATGRACIPFTGYRMVKGRPDNDVLRVLIMTQADGHYAPDGSVCYNFTKQRKIERCKTLLRRAGLVYNLSVYDQADRKYHRFRIVNREVPLWLRQFRSKTFGAWLFDESADIFFDELPYWDGYRPTPNSLQYSTCNKMNADMIQAFAHLSGRVASLKLKKVNKAREHWLPSYTVSVWLTPGNCHEIRNKPQVSSYKGQVFCAETESGYFLVRRDGRVWVTGNSGRLIQMQNLPQNHLEDLEAARSLVKSGNYEAVKMLYDDVPDTLSQLIRTAFIPRKGYKFIVSDFSAIEARVLSWLAGESWRMDVFKDNGDIYCATAARMFKVPVEKHGKNGHLRQKGKQAELACIAEGQLVLTDKGLVPIEHITRDHLLWDGVSWVSHEGVIYRGIREVITYEGLTATEDHLVWIEGKPEPIHFGIAAARNAHLVQTGDGGNAIWLGDKPPCHLALDPIDGSPRPTRTLKKLYDIRNAGSHHRFTVSGKLVHNCGYGGSVGALKAMGALDSGMSEDELKPLVDAWRASNPRIVQLWRDVGTAAMTALRDRTSTSTHGIRYSYESGFLFITLPSGRRLAYVKPRIGTNKFGGASITYEGVGGTKKWERLETYGAKLVENFCQSISRDLLSFSLQSLKNHRICMHIHDEVVIEAPTDQDLSEIELVMAITPPWAKGLPLNADGYETTFYKKD
jgi:hypothetical protein